jgi:hypothetical protein
MIAPLNTSAPLAGNQQLASGYRIRLQRFQSCYTQEPLLPRGVFLKKTPPFANLNRAQELWNRSSPWTELRAAGNSPALPRQKNCFFRFLEAFL